MPSLPFLTRDLIESLDQVLLPAARAASRLPLAVADSSYVPPGVQCDPLPDAPSLPTSNARPFPFGRRCEDSAYQVLTVPYLIGVVEGIVTLRTGDITGLSANPSGGTRLWRLPAGTFLLIPAGVPHQDSLYWKEWKPPTPESRLRLFWTHLLPVGALCHTSCRSQNGRPGAQPHVMAEDKYLALLLEVLAEEMRSAGNENQAVAQAMLLAFLLRLRRGLSSGARAPFGINMWFPDPNFPAPQLRAAPAAVAQARDYVQIHLTEKLTGALIASQVNLSPTHLNTLFRAHLDISLMGYVMQQRMNWAMSLLEFYPISVGEVAQRAGYHDLAHFSRAFSRHTGMTPLQFRRSVRKAVLPNNQ